MTKCIKVSDFSCSSITHFYFLFPFYNNHYFSGLVDAGCKIYRTEGVSGLYRGFWVNSIQIFSGFCYIGTYEGVRHLSSQYNIHPQVKTLIAGGSASLVGQTIIVPFDVISQHLMLLGLTERNAASQKKVNHTLIICLISICLYYVYFEFPVCLVSFGTNHKSGQI